MLATQFRQHGTDCPTMSFHAEISCLQEHFGSVDIRMSLSDASFKDIHLIFVDDLLLSQHKQANSEGNAFHGTILGGMDLNSACLAALFFLS